MTQWWNSAYNDVIIQLPQSIVDCLKHRIQNTKIKGRKCKLNEGSENLKGLFDRELTTYNNKKQCMKMNNKRYGEMLQELLEEKEKEYAAETKRIQVECTSKTMSLELEPEEILKAIERKDKFIAKQMMATACTIWTSDYLLTRPLINMETICLNATHNYEMSNFSLTMGSYTSSTSQTLS
ncbi:hypothetical protein PROFUN_03712 [Planoprotostelium fungivorum]|uniref:Uncharacterized protein n=1 Tax=Planoprotostelium fungivorum TaxID=1890364 RepID=A0A2P6NDM3_9EUKA|nr:hypothetical protein PROFUN_03712 [Planoprotostelium fungivorum]